MGLGLAGLGVYVATAAKSYEEFFGSGSISLSYIFIGGGQSFNHKIYPVVSVTCTILAPEKIGNLNNINTGTILLLKPLLTKKI